MVKKQADLIKNISDKDILLHLYFTQFLLLIFSFLLGVILFNDTHSFYTLWVFPDWNILWFGVGTALLVIIIDLTLLKWVPKALYDDGGINERLFQKRNVFHITWLCLLIAFAEEILFRGIIQTHFGLALASLIFAILHFRYLYKWVLLTAVILLSFLIGFVYELTNNLYVTVVAHFLIDFVFALKIRNDYLKSKEKR